MAPKPSPIPLYNTQFEHKDYTKNFNVTDNFSLEFAIRENLRLNAQFSLTKGTSNGEIFKSMNHSEFEANDVPLLERGTYNKSIGNTLNWNTNASINYNLTKDKHLLSYVCPLGNRTEPERWYIFDS